MDAYVEAVSGRNAARRGQKGRYKFTNRPNKGGDEGQMDVDEDVNAAQTFHDMIKEKAEIGQFTGERIALFEDINITTPRCVSFLSCLSLLVSCRFVAWAAA